MFVVGTARISPPRPGAQDDTGRLAVVLSSYNFLMNGYRALRSGNPITLMIDTTYRLVIQGHGTMPMCVMDEGQKTHMLAYAIVDKEDHDAHEYCLKELKAGVEHAAQFYHRHGLKAELR